MHGQNSVLAQAVPRARVLLRGQEREDAVEAVASSVGVFTASGGGVHPLSAGVHPLALLAAEHAVHGQRRVFTSRHATDKGERIAVGTLLT